VPARSNRPNGPGHPAAVSRSPALVREARMATSRPAKEAAESPRSAPGPRGPPWGDPPHAGVPLEDPRAPPEAGAGLAEPLRGRSPVLPPERQEPGPLRGVPPPRRREAQRFLTALGLASLGHCESASLPTSTPFIGLLRQMARLPKRKDRSFRPPVAVEQGGQSCRTQHEALLGPKPHGRTARIMVTQPAEAAGDYEFVRDLVRTGLNWRG